MKRGSFGLKSSRESFYRNQIKRDNVEVIKQDVVDNNISFVHLVLYSDSKEYNKMMIITREFYKTNERNIKTIYYSYFTNTIFLV